MAGPGTRLCRWLSELPVNGQEQQQQQRKKPKKKKQRRKNQAKYAMTGKTGAFICESAVDWLR